MDLDGDETRPKLIAPRSEVELKLAGQIAKGHGYRALRPIEAGDLTVYAAKVAEWGKDNVELLSDAFASDELVDEYLATPRLPEQISDSIEEQAAFLHQVLKERTRFLTRLKAELDRYETPAAPARVRAVDQQSNEDGSTIFLVHGRDRAAEQEVLLFLSRVTSVRPIVLHAQPNRGRTIIEKFEDYAAAATFAIVLLTADDEGGERGGTVQPRPRQNVVFELGFFYGKLGRDRVAALCAPRVERPSDISGVVYIELDHHGGWQFPLAREMKTAGLPVDLNNVLG